MFAGGLVLGLTLVAFAVWLYQREQNGWDEDRENSELDDLYYARRETGRRQVYVLFGVAGVLIVVAAFAGPGFVWGLCWLLVSILLVCVVSLALLDAMRTHRYHAQKLPEIRRQLLSDDEG
jgi:hypothetical protein